MNDSDAVRLRAEMAAARARVTRHLDAIELDVWQRADAAIGPTPAVRRRRLGALDVLVNAALYARERGWLRLLWDRQRVRSRTH